MPDVAAKPQPVLIELYKGKSLRIGKSVGKLYGGIVTFKEANPQYPVIWLGQKSYTVYDVPSRKNILYFDTLNGMLFKPKDLSAEEDNIDMVAQATQNVLIGTKDAENKMGIAQATNSVWTLAIGAMILLTIVVLAFLYVIWTHAPAPAVSYIYANGMTVNTTVHGATTTILNTGLGGPSIVPVPTS